MKYKGNYTDAYGRSTEPDRKLEKKQRLRKRSYEKHFDGYTVETVLGPDGKAVSVRIYTGALYRQELTTIQRRRLKMQYACFLSAALFLALGALCLPTASNYHVLIFALAWLPIALFIRMLLALGAFLPASQDLKLHEYNDGVRVLARVAMPAAVLSAVYIAVSLILLAIQQERLTALEILRVAMFAAAGGLTASVGRKERKIKYTEHVPSPAKDQQS